MSKEFFEPAEFADRQQRVRATMEQQTIELLLVINPININYLVGSATKAYQTFQCLFFPIDPNEAPVLLLRLPDVAEALDVSLVRDVRGWNGRHWEDPVDVLKSILTEKKWLTRRI